MSITLQRDGATGMRHHVRIGRHTLTVDEPPGNGGEDAGPTAHDLYDAALGACKALTVLWYANRKGIALRDIEVVVDRDDSEERNGTYRLKAALRLSGDLTDAQRDELMRVAGKCPVHRLMTSVKTEIETVALP
jgi:putative redox protein